MNSTLEQVLQIVYMLVHVGVRGSDEDFFLKSQ